MGLVRREKSVVDVKIREVISDDAPFNAPPYDVLVNSLVDCLFCLLLEIIISSTICVFDPQASGSTLIPAFA